jgi:raffinose/stachyose/melibiose transport system permease protein
MNRSRSIVSLVFLGLLALLTGYPFLWVLLGSLKTNQEIFSNSFWLPHAWQFVNYVRVWKDGHVASYFLNGALVSAGAVITVALFSSMASYALARFRFRLNFAIYTVFLLGLMIPWAASLLPVFISLRDLHLLDTRAGLSLTYLAFELPFGVFVITGFMKTIPAELEEAAVMDGCGYARMYAKVIIPLSRAALSTVAVLTFLDVWNDYLFALVFLSTPGKFTLALGLTMLRSERVSYYGYIMAGIVISIVPVMALFLVLQNQVIKGITAGAVKG